MRSMEDALKMVREKKQLFSHIRPATDMPVMPNKAGAGWGEPCMGHGHPWDGSDGPLGPLGLLARAWGEGRWTGGQTWSWSWATSDLADLIEKIIP